MIARRAGKYRNLPAAGFAQLVTYEPDCKNFVAAILAFRGGCHTASTIAPLTKGAKPVAAGFPLKDSTMNKFVIALAVAAALPMGAQAADNISYNYVQADYVSSHNDVPDDADGWGLKASMAVLPNMHVFGDFNRQTLDDSKLDIDTWRIGVGYNRAINEATDVVARLAYQQQDPELGHHLPGLSAEVGLNTAYGEHMQVYGALGWEDYTRTKGVNPKGEFFGRLGMLAKLNQNWSVNASLKYDVDGNIEVQAGPRFSW